jgi:hypothetical protein
MRRKGKTIRSKPDYVLVKDKRFFKKAYTIKPRGLASDHKMLVVQYSPTDTAHKFYRRYRKKRSMMPLEKGDQEADQPFNQLEDLAKEEETVLTEKDKWTDWISEDTWRLFDRRAAGQHQMSKRDTKMLTKEIKQSLAKDQKA